MAGEKQSFLEKTWKWLGKFQKERNVNIRNSQSQGICLEKIELKNSIFPIYVFGEGAYKKIKICFDHDTIYLRKMAFDEKENEHRYSGWVCYTIDVVADHIEDFIDKWEEKMDCYF